MNIKNKEILMKTILTYKCECKEEFYEDDEVCVNCGKSIDKNKLKEVEVEETTLPAKSYVSFDNQSLKEQAFHILCYLESEPGQTIVPDDRVRLLKKTLGNWKP